MVLATEMVAEQIKEGSKEEFSCGQGGYSRDSHGQAFVVGTIRARMITFEALIVGDISIPLHAEVWEA